MKKIIFLFSLLVIGLFLLGCAPQNAEDKLAVGDLTPEEKAQLPSDMKEGGTALAGKAVDFSGCIDADSTSVYDKNSLLTKSTTTYAGGSKEDKCYTWYKGTSQEKTRLIEGTCKNKKFLYWYATCSDYLGKDYVCKEGKCEQEVSDFAMEEVPLDWDITKPIYSKEIKGIFAKAVNSQGKEITLNNLKLELFMDANLQYYVKAGWEANVPPSISGIIVIQDTILTGQKESTQLDYISIVDSLPKIQGQSSHLINENQEYTIRIHSYYDDFFSSTQTNYLEYNFPLKTPSIAKAETECKKIVDNGPAEKKINMVFVPVDYSENELETFEKDVHDLLFGKVPDSAFVEQRRSFFDIPIFNQSFNLFNIHVIKDKVPCCNTNQLLSVAKSCYFNYEKQIIIVMSNSVLGMSYAEGIGTGNKIYMFKGNDWNKLGTVFAHEFAHLIGMHEEYYTIPSLSSKPSIESPNCEYGNLTCSKWCTGVDVEKTKKVHAAKEKYDACKKIFTEKDEITWKDFCPALDLKKIIEDYVATGGSYAGAKSQEEFCAFPLSEVIGYTCYAGTFWALDRDESLNLGIECQEGYQCYYGCGGNYEWTRSSFVNIMGGGIMGETPNLYKQKEKNAGEKILPDFSPAAHSAIKEYLENNFK